MTFTRRGFLGRLSGLGALLARPIRGLAQERLPTRAIPATGEMLPVIGLGSSKAVRLIPEDGIESLAAVLRMLVSYGGRVMDTTPYPEENERRFGQLLQSPDLRDELFITMKINTMDEQIGVQQVRQAQRLFGRRTLDLLQVMSLRGLYAHWPNLRGWKEAGETRYVGVTVSNYEDYGALESFITSEAVDFLQVNYSAAETLAEDRILPLAQDLGRMPTVRSIGLRLLDRSKVFLRRAGTVILLSTKTPDVTVFKVLNTPFPELRRLAIITRLNMW